MKILLIEDDLDMGNGIRIALTEKGMDVVWVRTLEDAARSLDGCDLVLLDLGLPDGDGLDLLHRLRRNRTQEDGGGQPRRPDRTGRCRGRRPAGARVSARLAMTATRGRAG